MCLRKNPHQRDPKKSEMPRDALGRLGTSLVLVRGQQPSTNPHRHPVTPSFPMEGMDDGGDADVMPASPPSRWSDGGSMTELAAKPEQPGSMVTQQPPNPPGNGAKNSNRREACSKPSARPLSMSRALTTNSRSGIWAHRGQELLGNSVCANLL